MSERLRIALTGPNGRMGTVLTRLISADSNLELAGGVGRGSLDAAPEILRSANVVIDFSAPPLLSTLLDEHRDSLAGRALVVGTTGLDANLLEALESFATVSPVLRSANFSVGVNLLLALAEQAARVLGDEYDAEIVETHHRRKTDAPSGTALELGRAVARGLGTDLEQVRRDGRAGHTGERPRGEIGLHAVRGGDVVGEHRVLLLGERERIELGHVAADRALFAEGALRAARWLAGRDPGSYTMHQVLGLP
ncbi:4-hydroxy-tetrahydrodipicolinate reductase [soil metagenome]